jgi:hypothetical protein
MEGRMIPLSPVNVTNSAIAIVKKEIAFVFITSKFMKATADSFHLSTSLQFVLSTQLIPMMIVK